LFLSLLFSRPIRRSFFFVVFFVFKSSSKESSSFNELDVEKLLFLKNTPDAAALPRENAEEEYERTTDDSFAHRKNAFREEEEEEAGIPFTLLPFKGVFLYLFSLSSLEEKRVCFLHKKRVCFLHKKRVCFLHKKRVWFVLLKTKKKKEETKKVSGVFAKSNVERKKVNTPLGFERKGNFFFFFTRATRDNTSSPPKRSNPRSSTSWPLFGAFSCVPSPVFVSVTFARGTFARANESMIARLFFSLSLLDTSRDGA